VIKILGQGPEKVTEGSHTGYWYRVMPEGGPIGYCFDYYLSFYEGSDQSGLSEGVAGTTDEDTVLNAFLTQTYRPEYYFDMIISGYFFLERFQPTYGLFPDREDKSIILRLPDLSREFEYSEITRVGAGYYRFPEANLEVTLPNKNLAILRFPVEGRYRAFRFITIREDIESLVQQEKERRKELFQGLYRRGSTLESAAYGTIQLGENRTFTWKGFERLVPRFVPQNAKGTGTLGFEIFMDPGPQSTYDGAVLFHFNETEKEEGVPFLFSYKNAGIQFLPVSSSEIEKGVIMQEPLNPLVLFFTGRSN
jgi:hypothetical protein